MKHLNNIDDIEETLTEHRLCLFYVKTPDCGVCNVMLDKVVRHANNHLLSSRRRKSLCAFYADIIEEPLIAGQFLVYSGPTVLLMLDQKEVYRGSGFIDLDELEHKIVQYTESLGNL